MISVILPTYNHAPYLRQRIDSILNQTYQDFELIILDDCSPDNSRDVIEEYRNVSHISHIIYNKINSGSTFKQWKRGIELAKGEYIWIAESDDYADPTFLEKIMDSISKYNSALCFSLTTIVDKENNTVMDQPPILPDYSMDINQFTENYLLYSNPICNASMVVFKKDAIAENLWNRIVNFKYCGDWLLWGSFSGEGNITVSEVKEYLNYFRTHSVNVSNKSEDRGLGILEGYKVSEIIAKRLHLKLGKEYSKRWYYKWQSYKLKFSYSNSVNKDILSMFIKKRPMVAYYELKRLISRLIKR
ncbi:MULTISPECIES: glycosyltransferase family 2 protein [Dysgonomonas]|uniref:glycosyltransferase family 2 protein n=1 Tax=Dysgonomonas TaxID=156973 RepID=UPI00208E94F7|nr:glycosyltransferase family 2 protein [Dysgonomonas mossii]